MPSYTTKCRMECICGRITDFFNDEKQLYVWFKLHKITCKLCRSVTPNIERIKN